MPHHIRPLAVSLLLTLAALAAALPATAAAPRGGMCTGPARCPKGYYYVGPPTCSCLPKPTPKPTGGEGGAR